MLLLFLAVAGLGGYAVFSLKSSAYQATRVDGRLNAVSLEIQVHNLEAARRVKEYLAQAKAKGVAAAPGAPLEEARFEVHEIRSLVTEAVAIAPTAAMRAKFEKIAAAAGRFDQAMGAAVGAFQAGAGASEAASAIDAYEDAAEELHETAEDGELAGRDASQSALERIERTSRRVGNTVLVISLMTFILAGLVSYKLSHAILDPVDHLKNVAESVSLGNLDVAVRRYSDDEIGDLADSFSRMVTAVKFFRMEADAAQSESETAVEGGQQ